MITPQHILAARNVIAPHVAKTPVEFSESLREELGVRVSLKLENLQVSGSFKPRGAFNKILKHPGTEFVAPTAGGHGVGLSYAARRLGAGAHILMPESADRDRIAAIRANGATVQLLESVPAAREKARDLEIDMGYEFVSAYSDIEMIEGGGTIAAELLEQLPDLDCLVCGVGGGGYVAGMAILLKSVLPNLRIYGVQQENGGLLARWHETRSYPADFELKPSIAEGIGAAVEEDSLTWPYLERDVDEFLLVREEDIRESLLWLLRTHKHYVEPSAVVGLAAIRGNARLFRQFDSICTVITGRNMSFGKFESLLAG